MFDNVTMCRLLQTMALDVAGGRVVTEGLVRLVLLAEMHNTSCFHVYASLQTDKHMHATF